MTRRSAVRLGLGTAGMLLTGAVKGEPTIASAPLKEWIKKGRIKQSVSRWCYGGVKLEALCDQAKAMGLVGIDLLGEADWATVKDHGLQTKYSVIRHKSPSASITLCFMQEMVVGPAKNLENTFIPTS